MSLHPIRKDVDKALSQMALLWGRPPRSPRNETDPNRGDGSRAGKIQTLGKRDCETKHSTGWKRQQYPALCQKQAAMDLYNRGLISHGTLANWFRANPEWESA